MQQTMIQLNNYFLEFYFLVKIRALHVVPQSLKQKTSNDDSSYMR
jgi:hypothetical protein